MGIDGAAANPHRKTHCPNDKTRPHCLLNPPRLYGCGNCLLALSFDPNVCQRSRRYGGMGSRLHKLVKAGLLKRHKGQHVVPQGVRVEILSSASADCETDSGSGPGRWRRRGFPSPGSNPGVVQRARISASVSVACRQGFASNVSALAGSDPQLCLRTNPDFGLIGLGFAYEIRTEATHSPAWRMRMRASNCASIPRTKGAPSGVYPETGPHQFAAARLPDSAFLRSPGARLNDYTREVEKTAWLGGWPATARRHQRLSAKQVLPAKPREGYAWHSASSLSSGIPAMDRKRNSKTFQPRTGNGCLIENCLS